MVGVGVKSCKILFAGAGPALGMFELFGRTGPLILGGRLFGR